MDEPRPGKTTFVIMVSPLPDRRKIRWSFVTGVESEQRAEGRAGHGGGAGLTGRGSQDRLLSLNRRSTL
ncbi:hypothetical protein MJT46_014442 [Ovis ammon polii x Ovis aries]|nr:hypothetical protein MJT46_014442 [Ovis ammon polii x Ovis aries]